MGELRAVLARVEALASGLASGDGDSQIAEADPPSSSTGVERGEVGNDGKGCWAALLAHQARSFRRDLDQLLPEKAGFDAVDLASVPTLRQLGARAAELVARHDAIRAYVDQIVAEMDFRFLYDDQRRLFTIGYSVANGRRDSSYYDLLASEARLASYLAIAKGDVPTEHWFHLGRPLTTADSSVALVSWGGTMFEYLMPRLVMHGFAETLLGVTYHAVVDDQIAYGREHGVPWGISESAYDVRDASGNYQYRSFGVPGLGLRANLGSDLVVAPYATALALPIRSSAAIANLRTFLRDGMGGRYGLYEAIDYTQDHLPPGVKRAIVRSFMVHHQAMSLLAIDNVLRDGVMLRRFQSDPLARSAELLLQERFPRDVPAVPLPEETESQTGYVPRGSALREFSSPNTPVPYTQVLSNGTYTVLVTNAGAGFSTCGDLAVTRWREDTTRDNWGTFCYVRDARSGAAWSAGYQPTRVLGENYRAVFSLEKAEFTQRVAGIDTRLEVAVSAEDNVEVRRVSLTNRTAEPRELELTSYAEVVLAPPGADEAHPAFGNLFVETECVPDRDLLLATRRPRSPEQPRDWAFHAVEVRGHVVGALQYETDRYAFIGRDRTIVDPIALHAELTQSVGPVLDPIFSLRRRVRVVPGGTVQVTFATGVAKTRDAALDLGDKYRAPGAANRVLEMAYAHAQAELHDLGLSGDEAHLIQRLTRGAIYADPRLRAAPEILQANQRGQSALWSYGISGDYPIVLVRIADADELGLVQQLIQSHQYWRLQHLAIDLVILVEQSSGYRQGLQEAVRTMIRVGRSTAWLNRPAGIFVLAADTMPHEDQILLQTVARVDLTGWKGLLAEQLPRSEAAGEPPAVLGPPKLPEVSPSRFAPLELREPTVFGGFSPDGREYVVNLRPGLPTTAPWINVVANETFGFIVSESGGGYTWAVNSQQNRLTPWSNDPVTDPIGEAIYLRDEESGASWSPLPHPRGVGFFRVRHGFGYSVFENETAEVQAEVTLFVPRSDPVKVYRLRLRNRSERPRRLSATFYVDWVLGPLRARMAPFVVTERDRERGAIFARNAYNSDFAARVAFVAASAPVASATGDRTAFLGRNRGPREPAALERAELDERFGAGFDPAGALRCALDLAPGEERELYFLLGQGTDRAESEQLIDRYRDPATVRAAFDAVVAWWRDLTGRVQVSTPDPRLDLLLNGWLFYQTLSCRVWGRSAFYQSGGAFGFRDQLQDVLALVHALPEQTRAQIVLAASRQFREGDVQHWWHPPSGRGVRTKCSDDYLWLPFVTYLYVRATGDRSVLDESVHFLTGRPLGPDESEYYDLPAVAPEAASIYEHCARSIEHALGRFGPHDLPLIGSGDWNDGMNLVGVLGRGESIWVGWFLYLNLVQMADLAESRGDGERATRYRSRASDLKAAIEAHGWDGAWYLRAYFDDGTPLGSARDEECKIDTIAQSWAVISGAGDPTRTRQALDASEEHLVETSPGLIKLLAPPFDRSALQPGYIKGYVPGVRENGGQYTHGALWYAWARSMLGEGARASELFTMLSPIHHAATGLGRYKVEPYVVVADVYAVPPHVGRGGWTWYTGSAGWMYRLGLEQILGIHREGDVLVVTPCIPPTWKAYDVSYAHGAATYQIHIENPTGVSGGVLSTEVDDQIVTPGRIPLRDDGHEHRVVVVLGTEPPR